MKEKWEQLIYWDSTKIIDSILMFKTIERDILGYNWIHYIYSSIAEGIFE